MAVPTGNYFTLLNALNMKMESTPNSEVQQATSNNPNLFCKHHLLSKWNRTYCTESLFTVDLGSRDLHH